MDLQKARTLTTLSNRLIRGFIAALVLMIVGFGLSTAATAQTTSGDLTGTVKDPNGAVIVKATVVVTNEDTGVAATSESGTSGQYHVTNLLPGKYGIAASSRKESVQGMNLPVFPGSAIKVNSSFFSTLSVAASGSVTFHIAA